jgi:hypothetical protein
MKRISKQAKAIADAHIKEELIEALLSGKTFSELLEEIEMRFTSITSILLSRQLFHQSNNYRSGVYKGFKILIDKI